MSELMKSEAIETYVSVLALAFQKKRGVKSCVDFLHFIYKIDKDLVYNLAMVRIRPNAPVGIRRLAYVAQRLQRINFGYEVVDDKKGVKIVIFGRSDDLSAKSDEILCGALSLYTVLQMLKGLALTASELASLGVSGPDNDIGIAKKLFCLEKRDMPEPFKEVECVKCLK